jgi:hypothetical protein
MMSKLELSESYAAFNREEAHRTAFLFATLSVGKNLEKFLTLIGYQPTDGSELHEARVYFEYAKLRDHWFRLKTNEEEKINLINSTLGLKLLSQKLPEYTPGKEQAFNELLVGRESASKKTIESPGNWGVKKLDEHFSGSDANDDFRNVCIFKWAFNIKPDIVIEMGRGSIVSVEAKFCSGEGQYPSGKKEIGIFRNRGISLVSQTEVQRVMVEDILRAKFRGVFITEKEKPSPKDLGAAHGQWREISWNSAMEKMDLEPFSDQQKDGFAETFAKRR